MKPVRLVRLGDVDASMIDAIRLGVVKEYGVACRDVRQPFDDSFAFHPERGQHHSTLILEKLREFDGADDILVGVTAHDLFIPILTFVFGEAQMHGRCAVVSYYRHMQSFYGLPDDIALTKERLVKTAIHEIGHTLGLTHCDDYDCVMAASHSVEWLDVKGSALCANCRASVLHSSTAVW
jgi:archaemetzincin